MTPPPMARSSVFGQAAMDTSELSSVSERFFIPIQLGMYALMLAVGVGPVVRRAGIQSDCRFRKAAAEYDRKPAA